MSDKIKCRECDYRGVTSDLLTAQNPFHEPDTIYGCPFCKSIDRFIPLCDEPGCQNEASCGTPTATGYRHTCGTHAPKGELE